MADNFLEKQYADYQAKKSGATARVAKSQRLVSARIIPVSVVVTSNQDWFARFFCELFQLTVDEKLSSGLDWSLMDSHGCEFMRLMYGEVIVKYPNPIFVKPPSLYAMRLLHKRLEAILETPCGEGAKLMAALRRNKIDVDTLIISLPENYILHITIF